MQFFVFAALVTAAVCQIVPEPEIINFVNKYDYDIATHIVNTQDGYTLQLFRMFRFANSSQVENGNKDFGNQGKPPVLLVHGLLSSGEDFVYGGPNQGLAFSLVDSGYDVFIGNLRGSVYGRRHWTLSSIVDAAFWRYSYHEIGIFDLPAIIDKVIKVSGQNKLTYVGHAQGATAFYIMAAERPNYQNKIQRMLSLGPVGYLEEASNLFLQRVTEHADSDIWVMRNLGIVSFNPSATLVSEMETACEKFYHKKEKICQNVYFLINGFNSKSANQTIVDLVFKRLPNDASVWQLLHLAQIRRTGIFASYKSFIKPSHRYELSNVTVPIAVMYTLQDQWSSPNDVQALIVEFPNVYHEEILQGYTNNLDFIYGNNLMNINKKIINIIQTPVEEKTDEQWQQHLEEWKQRKEQFHRKRQQVSID